MTDSEDPIGVAVIGAGHWGPHLIRNFYDNPATEVLWVIEPRDERRNAISGRFRSVRFAAEESGALSDPDVEAVVVATPTSSHYDLVKSALEAGKHVLVEKPLTNSVKTAREVVEIALAGDLVLMVGQVFLFNPAVQEAKRLIEGGSLGDIYYASMLRTNLGPVRTDVNAAWDLAAHDISIANYWLRQQPLTVSAQGRGWINPGVDDAVFAVIEYEDGILVHIHASWLNPSKSRFISVVGSNRMITVNDMDLVEPLRIYDKGVEAYGDAHIHDTFQGFRAQIREGSITIPKVSLGEPLRTECEEFVSRLRGWGSSVSDGVSGLAVVTVLEAVALSMQRHGIPVPIEEVGL
ncbi:MAG: Gfo/Idh/MocA family protein [Acidimicrobiia bacterium]